MKTIAISIDEATLQGVDRLARSWGAGSRTRARGANRSKVIRAALQAYLAKMDRERQEAREREVFAKHKKQLKRQAEALVAEQAKP